MAYPIDEANGPTALQVRGICHDTLPWLISVSLGLICGMTGRILVGSFALTISAEIASADSQIERIRTIAGEDSAAYTSGTYARLVDLTYPKLVAMIGVVTR